MKHIHAVKCVGNRAKQKCFLIISFVNSSVWAITTSKKCKFGKNRGKRDKREGGNCRLGLACSHVKGLLPPPPLGIFNQTRPSERTFCIYCNRIFIAPFLFQFIKNHFCLLSSKKVKKITTLLTGLTRSKMYAIKYILYKPYCGPYKCSLRGHRNSYLAWAKFWQRTHAKTITPAMQDTKN